MRADLCDLFDIDVPIFAFSHCRDVVAAVTNAGGHERQHGEYQHPLSLEMGLCAGSTATAFSRRGSSASRFERGRWLPFPVDLVVSGLPM